jgi:D-sedoheptulose 7-phosphate isomerase
MDGDFLKKAKAATEAALEDHLRVIREMTQQTETIASIAGMIVGALKAGHKLIAFGNGGSAADCQHFVGEMIGRFHHERVALPAIALTTNTSTITAVANDYDYSKIFVRQLEALGHAGDVAFGISTSGRSANVIKALELAKSKSMITIGMTGSSGGQMRDICDLCLMIPSTDVPRIQEGHIAAIHIISQLIEKEWV